MVQAAGNVTSSMDECMIEHESVKSTSNNNMSQSWEECEREFVLSQFLRMTQATSAHPANQLFAVVCNSSENGSPSTPILCGNPSSVWYTWESFMSLDQGRIKVALEGVGDIVPLLVSALDSPCSSMFLSLASSLTNPVGTCCPGYFASVYNRMIKEPPTVATSESDLQSYKNKLLQMIQKCHESNNTRLYNLALQTLQQWLAKLISLEEERKIQQGCPSCRNPATTKEDCHPPHCYQVQPQLALLQCSGCQTMFCSRHVHQCYGCCKKTVCCNCALLHTFRPDPSARELSLPLMFCSQSCYTEAIRVAKERVILSRWADPYLKEQRQEAESRTGFHWKSQDGNTWSVILHPDETEIMSIQEELQQTFFTHQSTMTLEISRADAINQGPTPFPNSVFSFVYPAHFSAAFASLFVVGRTASPAVEKNCEDLPLLQFALTKMRDGWEETGSTAGTILASQAPNLRQYKVWFGSRTAVCWNMQFVLVCTDYPHIVSQ